MAWPTGVCQSNGEGRPATWRSIGLIVLVLAILPRPLPGEEWPVLSWQGRTMGTEYHVKIVASTLSPAEMEALPVEIEARLVELNRQMSNYQTESELSLFNRAPADLPQPVSPELARVVRLALETSRRTGGAFDITVAPLVELWGFGAKKTTRHAPPPPEDIAKALAGIGWTHLRVTAKDELVKDLPGLSIDLGGIAKGFGVDEITAILQRHGVANAYVSIAGEVRCLGHNASGLPWRVGLTAPLPLWREGDPMAAALEIVNLAVSTSGDYQNYFTGPDGQFYSHIIDPQTGHPVRHTLGGVSVVAPNNAMADALSTALFVLGPEQGLRFIEDQPSVAALFVLRQPDGSFRQLASSRFAALTGYRPVPRLTYPPVNPD